MMNTDICSIFQGSEFNWYIYRSRQHVTNYEINFSLKGTVNTDMKLTIHKQSVKVVLIEKC